MSGGGGRLSKLKDNSAMGMGDSTPAGTIALRPGVPMVGGAGRSGEPSSRDKLVGVSALSFECLIIGVTVTGCGGRPCGVKMLLVGVPVVSAATLSFIMGVVVCGGSGVAQGVSWLLSCRVSCLTPNGLCGVTSIILVNVTGGSGVLRRSSEFSVESHLTCAVRYSEIPIPQSTKGNENWFKKLGS